MNKTQYRIVFNAARDCMMAVAETAEAQGKSASGQTQTVRHTQHRCIRTIASPMQLACWLVAGVWGWSLPLMHTAQAQTVATRIVADPNAPKTQQATILRSGNGVIQANIQTPSAAGVSRNTYSQFDVGNGNGNGGGAILNNSRTNVQTQQGGWVQANPWLATGAAKVILNEVNSSKPSQLKGYLEVAGQRAEVIVANPAGISVDGAGFINASRITLTTGTPILSSGSLDSYRVQGGTVRIDGQGLDTRGADFTAILARALQVNAGVWANELQVVTGANNIQASSVVSGGTPQTSAAEATSPAPSVALDVAQLGGMYAGKIHLIGTEAGLGVRNAGQIQATNGPLTLSHEGWLSNSGTIQTTQDLGVATQGRIDNSGSIYATGQLRVSTLAAIVQTGAGAIMAAQGNATFTAASLSTATDTTIGAGIQPNGQLANTGDLSINTSVGLQLQGQAMAGGQFKISASSMDLATARITAGQIDFRAMSGNINTLGATITAVNPSGQLKLTTPDTAQINNSQGNISGAQVNVSTGQLNNTQGYIGAQNLSIDTHQSTVTNTSGTLLASQAVLLQTGALDNQAGLIQSGTQLSIDTHGQALNNSQAVQYPGRTQGEGAGQGGLFAQGQLSVSTGQLNNDAGYIASKGALNISTTGTANTNQGQILSLSDLRIQATGTLDNTQGLIRSATQTELTAQEIKNLDTLASKNSIQTGIEGQTITIVAAKLQNDKGAIRAAQNVVVLSAGQINNNAGLISAGQTLSLQDLIVRPASGTPTTSAAPTLTVINKDGVLIADSALVIDSQSLGGDGQILSKGSLQLDLTSDFNNSGNVIANADAIVVAANINNSGNMQAGQNLQSRAANITNSANAQITGKTTQLAATGTLTNRGLIDGQDTLIDAATLNNIGTGRIFGDRLSIGATTLLNDSETLNGTKATAVIAARERLDIGAKTITNREGALIFSAGDMYIGGQLNAQRQATGQADTVNNNSATIEALGKLSLNTATLNNTNEHFASALRPYGSPEDRFYIQPQGNAQKYLPTTFNKNDNGQLITYTWAAASGGSPELGKTPMPTPGQLVCTGEGDAEVCEVASGSEYAPVHPAWAYFKITAPALEPAQPGLVNPTVPTLKAPQDPTSTDICKVGSATYSASACSLAQTQYQADKTAYDKAWTSYNKDKGEYDDAWAKYNNDHTQWEADISVAYDLLGDAITQYNAGFQSGTFANWTQYQLVRTFEKSVITQSDPGMILSGGAMSLIGQNLLNDKSQILAGGKLSGDLGSIVNQEGEGQLLIHEDGTAQYHGTRRGWYRWRRVTKNAWGELTPYHDTQTQTISLPVAKSEGNTTFSGTGTEVNAAGVVSVKASTSGPAHANTRNAINVQAILVSTKLPTSSLYKTQPQSTSQYLVETDPQFAGYKTWLGSDYMLQSLHLNPGDTQKRLGDGFYEQKLIRDQVLALTGNRFLGDYASDEAQYMALMTNGLTTAKALQLRPGIALSASQMAQLTSDLVWMVEQTVTLADGSTQKVLVPQVYARVKEGDMDGTGALMSGKDVSLKLTGDLTNSGTIAGRNVLEIGAKNILNLGGRLSADTLSAKASEDITNVGGSIEAQSKLEVSAGRDLNLSTTTQTTKTQTGANSLSNTVVDRVAGLYVKGQSGALLASAGRDLNVKGAIVSNQGTGQTSLSAGHDLNLDTVITGSSQSLNWDANNRLRQSNSQDVGSQIKAGGNLSLTAGNDLKAKAAQVSAGQELKATAGNSILITEGQTSETFDEARKSSSKGVLSSTTTTTRTSSQSTTAVGSSLEGQSVSISAGQDLTVKGSNVLADQSVNLNAGRNVNIEAAQNTQSQTDYRQETKSGLMSGGGIGFTVGKRQQSLDQQGQSTSAAQSTIGAINGNVTINAGGAYTQTGSDVMTPAGDITITAKKVDITEARETGSQSTEQKFKQSGLTVAVTSPVLSALQTASSQLQAAGNTGSGRMQLLAGANAAFNLKQAADALKAGQGDANGMVRTGAQNPDGSLKTNADGTPETKQGNAADKAGGIGISISVGSSSSQSKQSSSADNARGSSINAGGNITIQATGAGKDSNLTVQGSSVQAAGTTRLQADNQVNLLAVQNTTSESSSNQSKSGSVGVAMQLGNGGGGMGFTASASKATGQGAGNSVTYTNTQVAGNTVNIDSGGDTTLKGAVVKANQVTADVGGNLSIQSLQDQNQYKESSKSAGGSIMVGAGVSGSINLAKSSINSNYQSVGEQSAIRAGDGGFQVEVKGNTTLTGAQITSTQAAIDNNKNSFQTGGTLTTTDLQNKASYEAKSVSVGVGAGALPGKSASAGMSGVGFGSDKESASSTTTAGISGVAGNTAVRTGDASTSLKTIFDADKVKKEIEAQVTITQEFGKQAGKAITEYTNGQRKALQEQAKNASTPEDKAKAEQAIKDVNMQERALNILTGALTGMVGSVITKEALSTAAEKMRDLMVEDSRKFAGVVDSTGKVLSNVSGPSEGVRGDGVKVGGTRVDLDLLCGVDNARCTFPKNPDGSLNTTKPIEFKGVLDEFVKTPEGQKLPGATGGIQGAVGTLFGVPYAAGSWQDKLVESFAGSHDFIGGKASGLYDAQGNIKRGMSDAERAVYDKGITIGAIPLAAPFAAAEGMSPEIWKAIGILLGAGR